MCDPSWRDPLETSYAKTHGGRWNPPGEFGALYLCATILVAAANARRNYENEIATLYDLLPEQRPDLQRVEVKPASFVDVVTPAGIRALHLPASYPLNVSWNRCQTIARKAYVARSAGIACRSSVEIVGEELAVFDSFLSLVSRGRRLHFVDWYPVEVIQKSD